MAYSNPANVAKSYYQGLEMGEQRKQRGLDQDRIRKEEAAKAKQAASQAQMEQLTGGLYNHCGRRPREKQSCHWHSCTTGN